MKSKKRVAAFVPPSFSSILSGLVGKISQPGTSFSLFSVVGKRLVGNNFYHFVIIFRELREHEIVRLFHWYPSSHVEQRKTGRPRRRISGPPKWISTPYISISGHLILGHPPFKVKFPGRSPEVRRNFAKTSPESRRNDAGAVVGKSVNIRK